MSPRICSIFVTTIFLLASKFDEIDDRLVFIQDVQKYYKSIDLDSRHSSGNIKMNLIPTYNDIVECERQLMMFFDWNISYTLTSPLMFLECFQNHGILVNKETSSKIVQSDIEKACNDI